MREYLSKSCYLSHPERHGRSGFRRNLDRDRRKAHAMRDPPSRKTPPLLFRGTSSQVVFDQVTLVKLVLLSGMQDVNR